VKSSLSPCGKWLATGCSSDGKAFLFDVSNPSRGVDIHGMGTGIELQGHTGEVGAIDWASNALATSSDDGTVRVWRPDVEIYRKCVRDPEEKWNWRWVNGS
jgi:denticleless